MTLPKGVWRGRCEDCSKHSNFLAFMPRAEPARKVCVDCYLKVRPSLRRRKRRR